jgi:hypothetical protein
MGIGRVRDALNLVWWMKYRARFVCPGTACIRQDFSEVVQQCSLGSPELLLMALMAYPDVNLVEPFLYRCLREAVPPQLRMHL